MKTISTYKRIHPPTMPKNTAKKLFDTGQVIISLCCVLLGRLSFAGMFAPFGLGWYAVNANTDHTGIMLVGTTLGILLMPDGAAKAKYLVSLGLCFLINKFIKCKPRGQYLLCAGALLLVHCAMLLFTRFTYYDLSIGVLEAAAMVGLCFLFSISRDKILQKGTSISDEAMTALTVFAGCVLAGFSGIHIFGVRVCNVPGIYLTLAMAYAGGTGSGAATGAVLGLVCLLMGGGAISVMGGYSLIGICAGAMKKFGKIPLLLVVAFAGSLFLAYFAPSDQLIPQLLELVLTLFFFYFTPRIFLAKAELFVQKNRRPALPMGGDARQKDEITRFGRRMISLLQSLSQPRKADNPTHLTDINQIGRRLAQRVCPGCSLNSYCWKKNLTSTGQLIDHLSEKCQQSRSITARDLMGKCINGDKMIQAAKTLGETIKSEKIVNMQVSEMRSSCMDQYEMMATVIGKFNEKLQTSYVVYRDLSDQISKNLYRNAVFADAVCAAKTGIGLYEVSMEVGGALPENVIEDIVSDIMQKEMAIQKIQKMGDKNIVTLSQRAVYGYDVGISALDTDDNHISGDLGYYFVSEDDHLYCVMCDGMGSGQDAAQDSIDAANMLHELIMTEFDLGQSIEMINHAMITDSKSERCISLDIAKINLHSGAIELAKAGAPATVIQFKNNSVIETWPSMPAGILQMENVEVHFSNVEKGCYLIMMSDGVVENISDKYEGENFVAAISELCYSKKAKEMADSILMSALSKGVPKDDMTVLVAKLYQTN